MARVTAKKATVQAAARRARAFVYIVCERQSENDEVAVEWITPLAFCVRLDVGTARRLARSIDRCCGGKPERQPKSPAAAAGGRRAAARRASPKKGLPRGRKPRAP